MFRILFIGTANACSAQSLELDYKIIDLLFELEKMILKNLKKKTQQFYSERRQLSQEASFYSI